MNLFNHNNIMTDSDYQLSNDEAADREADIAEALAEAAEGYHDHRHRQAMPRRRPGAPETYIISGCVLEEKALGAFSKFENALATEYPGDRSIPHTNVMGNWMIQLLRGEAMPIPTTDIERRVYPNLQHFVRSYAKIVPDDAWHTSVMPAVKAMREPTVP
jgi:hypothetical protein